jgi:hypothetical protein
MALFNIACASELMPYKADKGEHIITSVGEVVCVSDNSGHKISAENCFRCCLVNGSRDCRCLDCSNSHFIFPRAMRRLSDKQVVNRLKSLARVWPKSLWLFAVGGKLCVMHRNQVGEVAVTESGSIDQNYVVDTIDIPSDGGNW